MNQSRLAQPEFWETCQVFSWTAANNTSTLITTNATYTLGTPADNWGRTWALGDFTNTNFHVRVIDVASSTARTFSLDSIVGNVTYQP